jgi:hypothetical protein
MKRRVLEQCDALHSTQVCGVPASRV